MMFGGSHIDVPESVAVGNITEGGPVWVGPLVIVGVAVTEVPDGAVVGAIPVPFVGDTVGAAVVGAVPDGSDVDSVPFKPGIDVGSVVAVSIGVVLLPGVTLPLGNVTDEVPVGIEVMSVGVVTGEVG